MTKCITSDNITSALALVAQLDRVLDYESRGQGFESLLAHQVKPIPKWVSVFLFISKKGREPERVAALNKQSGGLFVASESLSDSESQLALAKGKSGESLPAHQKTNSNRAGLFYFICRNMVALNFYIC